MAAKLKTQKDIFNIINTIIKIFSIREDRFLVAFLIIYNIYKITIETLVVIKTLYILPVKIIYILKKNPYRASLPL